MITITIRIMMIIVVVMSRRRTRRILNHVLELFLGMLGVTQRIMGLDLQGLELWVFVALGVTPKVFFLELCWKSLGC